MSGPSDWELVSRAREGNDDAFAELVRRYQSPVIHFCQRMLGSLQEAEDLAQESFMRVYRYLPRLRPDAKFSTVLFGITRNLALNAIRDGKRRGRGAAVSLSQDANGEWERPIPDKRAQPDEAARRMEIESLLAQALEGLSPEHREVLLLREFQGMDYETIARIVQTRPGTVKSRLARAREQLRARLIALGGELV